MFNLNRLQDDYYKLNVNTAEFHLGEVKNHFTVIPATNLECENNFSTKIMAKKFQLSTLHSTVYCVPR